MEETFTVPFYRAPPPDAVQSSAQGSFGTSWLKPFNELIHDIGQTLRHRNFQITRASEKK